MKTQLDLKTPIFTAPNGDTYFMHQEDLTKDILICPLQHLLELIGENTLSLSDLTPAYDGESAGLDLYNAGPDMTILPVIDFDHELQTSGWEFLPEMTRKAGWKKLMPTGIKVRIPKGYVGLLQERGSVVKTPLKIRAGVIDSGFCGEIFVNMINISQTSFVIKSGEKSPFQLVVTKINNKFHICDENTYDSNTQESVRKDGQIGSSDKR